MYPKCLLKLAFSLSVFGNDEGAGGSRDWHPGRPPSFARVASSKFTPAMGKYLTSVICVKGYTRTMFKCIFNKMRLDLVFV